MKKYWASVEKEKIGAEIMAKVDGYKKYVEKTGILGDLRKSYDTYYGQTNIADVDQSLKAIHVNHYANLIRHIHVMVTSTRPAWEVRAVNTDTESQADTQLAGGLLDYYMREKKLDQVLTESVEKCLFLKEGWVALGWNVSGGEIYGKNPETGDPIYEGDVEFKTHTLLDVTRDVTKKDMAHNWYILRDQKNKYDLAAKYPELADKLIGLGSKTADRLRYELAPYKYNDDLDTDMIDVYELRHDKTDAMPEGRLTVVASDDIVLFDGPLPYKRSYVFPITSAKAYQSAFGHSNAMDLLPIQDAFNMTVSAILTNQAANAVQNFQCPKGAAPRVTQIMDGMNVFEYDPKAGKMETMDLLKTAPEVFNFANFLSQQAELVSGVNQIARGNAPGTMSGTAMALIQQQAIQFSSGVQVGLNSLSESVGTGLLELLQTFAVVPRIAMIAGKSKRSFMRKFKGEDLKGISRVFVDNANPLTKTSAGRVEIANQLLQTQGMIKTPEQYIAVLTTGNLEPLYEHENGQNMLIRSENEWLMDGKQVTALMTDDHALHVLEHQCVLNSPEARENPTVVQQVLAHIQEHINFAKTMDPVVAAMLKQASFAAPQPPAPEQMGAPQGQGPAPVMDNQNPITAQAEAVALPSPAMPPEMMPPQ